MNEQERAARPFRCGIVPMDHYGACYNDDVLVYGENLAWAVIESNFFLRRNEREVYR